MITRLILTIMISLGSLLTLQAQPQPPKMPQQKKPLEILAEIQKKMEEIESELARGSLGQTTQLREEQVRREIEKLMRHKRQAQQALKQLIPLLVKSGYSSAQAQEMLQKLWGQTRNPTQWQKTLDQLMEQMRQQKLRGQQERMEAIRKQLEELQRQKAQAQKVATRLSRLLKKSGLEEAQVIREIEKLLKSSSSQEKVQQAIEKLIEDIQEQQKVANQIQQLLEQTQCKQCKVVDGIKEIIKMAKTYSTKSCSRGPNSPEQKPLKPSGSKPKDKDPANSRKKAKKQHKKNAQKDKNRKPYDPKDKRHKDRRNPPPDDKERWGNLPPTVREYMNAIENQRLPGKYRDLILDYYSRLGKMKSKR